MSVATTSVAKKNDLIYLRDLILTRSAIVLEPEKDYLLQSRLEPVAKEAGLISLGELVHALRTTPTGPLHEKVVEAMTTNETSFFRDIYPFDAFRDSVLPDMINKRADTRKISIWCGASASGQEPYTIAMVIREHFPELATWDITFLATDLSTQMLEQCREGKYSQLAVNRGLPAQLLMKYFDKKGMSWRVKKELRNMIDFQPLNLAGRWPPMPKVDIVWLRNVLIYFNVEMKKEIFQKVRDIMQPDGYFFLGGAETTMAIDDHFDRLQYNGTSCYRLGNNSQPKGKSCSFQKKKF